jgi:hypothetical protein
MTTDQFCISLRLRSADDDFETIYSKLPFKVSIKHKKGDQRKTPKGQLLDGIYKENYCVFEIKIVEHEEMHQAFNRALDDLMPYKKVFHQLRNTNGQSEFFVFWSIKGNSGEIFSHELMQKFAELKIDLGIDAYADGDSET